jgi:hypothetical protein
MKSRFNHHCHNLHRRQFRSQHEPRAFTRSSRPSTHLQVTPSPSPYRYDAGAEKSEVDTPSYLENEISTSELNDFCFCCIEQLSLSKQHDSAKQLIAGLISEKLPSYNNLKSNFLDSHQAHQKHHQWTQQMYHAVEPLLQQKTDSLSEQETLSELALKCVEQDMQLHYRAEQLRLRVAHLEQVVPQHLIQMGKEIGLPETIMVKLAKLIAQEMQSSS